MSGKNRSTVTKMDHVIFVLVTVMYWFTIYSYVPILTAYLDFLGATYMFIGVVVGSYGLLQMLIRLPLGIYSDVVKRRRPFIILGIAIGSMSSFGFILTDQLGWILFFRALAGVSAATWVAFTVLYASYFSKDDITKAMGWISVTMVLGQLLSMIFSGVIVEWYGWMVPFWIGGIAGVLGLILCFWLKEEKEEPVREPIKIKELLGIIKESLLIKVTILSILAYAIIFITIFGFTPNYALELGASTVGISYLVILFIVPHAFAAIIVGKWLAPRIGNWPTLLIGFLVSAIFTGTIPLINSFSILLITQAINGFALGLVIPLLLGMSIESVDDQKRATAMGFYQAVYAVGMFVGPFVAGILNSIYDLVAGFYFGGLIGVCGVVLVYVWQRVGKQSMKGEFRRGTG
ncbi:MFS transporter [Alkalihalobacterium alkalinitrilicum]|uniref:MFS transporter n=1 Tax=Alkalihalobacterium alkalinitrilicum TaxID=427920 RepID=UPI001EE44382|nr:MFS transporter [Alkalihalobacterium alkalinitrilicum]